MSERREFSRVNLSLPVKVHLNRSKDREIFYRSEIEDLSVGGFRIDLPNSEPLKVGQSLEFEIDTIRSPKPVKVKGELCWIESTEDSIWTGKAGVRLVGMEADDWDRWLHLMLAQGSVFPPTLL
jgi:c-di-GMP-binding flagellar brake protein YcgR